MDKLTILNRALGATGNNLLNMLADPDMTPEWDASNEAFGRALDDLMSRHSWPFGEERQALVLAGTDTTERYAYSYAIPSAALHLRHLTHDMSVLLDGWTYRGNTIRSVYSSGLYAVFNTAPAHANWHPQAAEILTRFVEVDLLRRFNEDYSEATLREAWAEKRLAIGRSTIAQQNPARNVYRSTIADARRTRRG